VTKTWWLAVERRRCPGQKATGASLRLCPNHRECLIVGRATSMLKAVVPQIERNSFRLNAETEFIPFDTGAFSRPTRRDQCRGRQAGGGGDGGGGLGDFVQCIQPRPPGLKHAVAGCDNPLHLDFAIAKQLLQPS